MKYIDPIFESFMKKVFPGSPDYQHKAIEMAFYSGALTAYQAMTGPIANQESEDKAVLMIEELGGEIKRTINKFRKDKH